MTSVLGVDPGCTAVRDADAAAHAVVARLRSRGGLEGAVVLTHLTRAGGPPRVVLSVEAPALEADELAAALAEALPAAVPEPPDPATPTGAAAALHDARTSGRAVHFPGVERLRGTLTVAEVLAGSAVEHVRVLGGGVAEPHQPLATREHVRPAYEDGRLVLAAEWAAGRTLVPFECPDPTPCCADHA